MQNLRNELLRYFNEGSEQAFTEVYKLYYLHIYLLIGRFGLVKEDKEEIVSAAFVTLFQAVLKGKQFESSRDIRDFLYIVARNAAINLVRRSVRYKGYRNEFQLFAASKKDDVEERLSDAYIEQLIHTQMEHLPDQCRRIFRMLYFDRLTCRQIAGRLNLSHQTILNQKARAIALLRKYILQHL